MQREVQLGGGDVFALRTGLGLQAHMILVVVRGDGAFLADHHEAALGLGLVDPRIGESAPAGFELGEAGGVAGHGDAVLVDFQAFGLVDGGGDFDRLSAI